MSGWYLDGLQQLLTRTIPESAGIWAVGVNDDYVFDETHIDFTPITPHILLPEQQLSDVTIENALLDAADTVWLAAGADVLDRSLILKGVIIYFQDVTLGALLTYIDSATVGLPQTLTGVNVTAKWDARGILRL